MVNPWLFALEPLALYIGGPNSLSNGGYSPTSAHVYTR